MYRIPFYLYDVFTDTPSEGNLAGVFFDDDGALTPEECAKLCDEVHLESAFVTPADAGSGADYRLRYYTGTTRTLTGREPIAYQTAVNEVPFCGHDTVAVTAALQHTGRLAAGVGGGVRYQTPVGIVEVLTEPDGTVMLLQNLPEFGPIADADLTARVAGALGCTPDAITATGMPVQRVSTGTPWLIVPVEDRETVDAAPSDFAAITELSRETGTFGIYVFAPDAVEEDAGGDDAGEPVVRIWSRCFAPIAGLNEDPVTGSASGALGGYLAAHGSRAGAETAGKETVEVTRTRQGFAGGRGGSARIVVGRGPDGVVTRVAVSGRATLVAEGVFSSRP